MVGRRIVIVRHGERVDNTFTDEWIVNSFDEHGKYKKNNLNMPDSVVKRVGSPKTFLKDCPLTQVGTTQGILVGKGLQQEKVLRDGFDVYVSPSLRSIETASAVGKGMGINFPMKIEPCFFEWTKWFPEYPEIPSFLSNSELIENGFSIDKSYSPTIGGTDLVPQESLENYYERTYQLVLQLLSQSSNDLLIVAHGATLDTVTRQLTACSIRGKDEFFGILRSTPYCATAVCEQNLLTKKWSIAEIPRLNMSHTERFDYYPWRTLC